MKTFSIGFIMKDDTTKVEICIARNANEALSKSKTYMFGNYKRCLGCNWISGK